MLLCVVVPIPISFLFAGRCYFLFSFRPCAAVIGKSGFCGRLFLKKKKFFQIKSEITIVAGERRRRLSALLGRPLSYQTLRRNGTLSRAGEVPPSRGRMSVEGIRWRRGVDNDDGQTRGSPPSIKGRRGMWSGGAGGTWNAP